MPRSYAVYSSQSSYNRIALDMPGDYTGKPDDTAAYQRWLDAIDMEDAGLLRAAEYGSNTICPHCDGDTSQIQDVTPANGAGKNFWCKRCSAGWLSIADPGRHYWHGEIHDYPCHKTGKIDESLL